MDRLGGFFGFRDREEDFDDDYVEEDDTDLDPPPSPVGQDERRMQVRAYNHWATLLGDLNFPHISDLEPDMLDDFGPYSVLLDLSDDIDDPKVAFVGSELTVESGQDSTLSRLSAVPSRSVLSRITDHYMQIIANQAPIGFEAEFSNERGANVLYRGILLPYSSDNETIDFIYGVINWKEMADQQTADELLLAIDQALGPVDDGESDLDTMVETAEMLTSGMDAEHSDSILELGHDTMTDSPAHNALPQPSFGAADDDEDRFAEPSVADQPATRVDALGNPIGNYVPDDMGEPEYEDDFDHPIKTAADYGLPDWDDEEEGDEDVDAVVDPLADDETSSSLISLVSRGGRTKKSVDLSHQEPAPAIPQAYEGEGFTPAPRIPEPYKAPAEEPQLTDVPPEDVEEVAAVPDAISEDATPEGLYDCLAAAREMAQAAQNTEDRSRKTLYSAVARAYDFSLEAQSSPGDFNELLIDNGLTVQDRAPMTPIVKLVFGADYDKTRLTEYAAVLMHAHRIGVERGKLATFLREAEGGLKGIVNAERDARKEEQGKAVADKKTVRPALAKKLRALEPLSLADLEEDGAEFALVMIRRTAAGTFEIVGEIPDDVPLVERAARKLLA